jgi:transcription initiation factor TFIID subunit TAF12
MPQVPLTPPQPPKLLDQLRQAIRVRHMSYSTEQNYVQYARDFILYHNKRHPNEMGESEIRMYINHLACVNTGPN